jgi:hypothetical protein
VPKVSWPDHVRLGVVLCAAVASLGGCAPDQAIKNALRSSGHGAVALRATGGTTVVGSWTTTALSKGALIRHGTKFTSKGTTAVGTFSFRLLHPTLALERAFGGFSSGVRHSSDDYSGDTTTGTAVSTGIQIVQFSDTRAGEICISSVTRYSKGGASVSNSFRTLGGTGKGARFIASGTYRTASKGKGKVAARALGTATLGASRPLPPSCLRLKRKFGLH